MERLLLGFYVRRRDGVTVPVPYAEDPDTWSVLGLLLNVEDDAVHACPLAVQQVAGRVAQFVGFGNDGATGRHLGQGPNGGKQPA